MLTGSPSGVYPTSPLIPITILCFLAQVNHVNLPPQEGDREFLPPVTPLQLELEQKKQESLKDSRIADLQNTVMTQGTTVYVNAEQVSFMTNNSGGFSGTGSVSGDINNVQGENNQQRVSKKISNFYLQNAQFGGGQVNADTVKANQIGGNITNYNPEQKQNLADAAAEIQQLLNHLSQSYPTATTSEKMTVVAKAVDEIENNPTLKARVIGALKAGGTEAFKELIDNPLINILVASIEGWQEAE